jgi:hypothetical protein
MTRHVHAQPDEMHTFPAQTRPVNRECRNPVRVNDSMERYVPLVAVPQGVADGACRARPPCQLADKSVCRDTAWRDAPRDGVDPAPPRSGGR